MLTRGRVERKNRRQRTVVPNFAHKLLSYSTRIRTRSRAEQGYLLPTVIVLGVAIAVVSVLALQTIARNSITLNQQMYAQLADEASKAGIAAALSCLKSGNPLNASWSTLAPNTNCKSLANANKPADVYNDGVNISSTYSVAAPFTQTSNTILLTSTGTAYVKTSSGQILSSITKTTRNLANVTINAGTITLNSSMNF